MKPSQLGAQMYSFREFIKTPEEVRSTLREIRKMGYEAVQLSSSIASMPNAELSAMLKENNLIPCSSHDPADRILEVPEEIGKLFSPSALHTVVLLGPETCGAAEILASKLFASHRGIGIGAPTKGRPYSRRVVTLSSRRWLVPQPPAGAEEVRYEPCVPQIRVSPLPRTRVEDLKRHGDPSHSGDPALIRASDLLISLDLLEQKGLKK